MVGCLVFVLNYEGSVVHALTNKTQKYFFLEKDYFPLNFLFACSYVIRNHFQPYVLTQSSESHSEDVSFGSIKKIEPLENTNG